MTLEEFEAEAERLGFCKKVEDFVPHFEHAASGRRVDYVPAARNCHLVDFLRTLEALRATSEGAEPPQDEPSQGDWMSACGLHLRKAPPALGWRLRRLQEDALSSVVGRSVVVSEETIQGEALEIEALLPGHGRTWLVLHPRDAEAVVKAATGPRAPGKASKKG